MTIEEKLKTVATMRTQEEQAMTCETCMRVILASDTPWGGKWVVELCPLHALTEELVAALEKFTDRGGTLDSSTRALLARARSAR